VQVGSTVGVAQVDLTTNNEGAEQMCAVALATLRVVDIKSAVKSV
jgi:hypothetical protein